MTYLTHHITARAQGIVNLGSELKHWSHEERPISLLRSSFPLGNHRLCGLSVHRFWLSLGDVEDLLAERGIIVSYETIRLWCQKFGAVYARKLKRRQGRLGDTWHLGDVFIRINGQL